MRRATIEDTDLINEIILNPAVYPFIVDDGSPVVDKVDSSVVLGMNEVFTLLPTENTALSFMPDNYITYEVHIFSLPEDRINTANNVKKSFGWMFVNTNCKKIVARIPEYNIGAYATAVRAGLVKEGIDRKSIEKDSTLYDRILFGLTKEEWKCLS